MAKQPWLTSFFYPTCLGQSHRRDAVPPCACRPTLTLFQRDCN